MTKRILFVTPVCPYGHDGGHAARVRQMLELLQERHEVWVLYAPYIPGPANPLDRNILKERLFEYPPALISIFQWIRILKGWTGAYKPRPPIQRNLRHADVLAPPFLGWFTKCLTRRISAEVVFIEYVFMSAAFSGLPDSIRKIIDAHDEFGCRYERLDPKIEVGWPWFMASLSHETEAMCLNRADVTLAIQYEEAERFRCKGVRHCVGLPFVPEILEVDREAVDKMTSNKKLVYFGSDWSPNVHGLRWFLEEVWPLIIRKDPDAQLEVAGSICRALHEVPYGVQLLGRVDNIRTCVKSARLFICPVFQGTGFNIKMLEALAWGMPFVGTPMALRGLPPPEGPAFPLTEDPETFCSEVVSLLNSDALCRERAAQAVNYVEQLNAECRVIRERSI